MLKRLAVTGLSVCALAGLFAAPASAAPSGCISLYANVNGTELINQSLCTP